MESPEIAGRIGNRGDLTKGSIVKNIWRLAFPLIVGNLLNDAFNFIDMLFVGKLGPASIAAVAMSGVVVGIMIIAAIGIGAGAMAMVARFVGAKEFEKADHTTVQSLFMGIVYSIALALIGPPLSSPLLKILGAQPDVVLLGASYLKIVFVGSFTIFVFVLLASSLRGAGDALTPTKALALATFLNVALDPLFIFGIWKFPRMGVAGSSLATVISRGCGMVYLLHIFFTKKSVLHLNLKKLKPDFSVMYRIIKIGVFSSLEMLTWNMSGLIMMRIVAIYGTFVVAAYGIGMRMSNIILMPGFGIGQAAATLVGQNLGARKPDRAEKSAWLSVGFYQVIMVCGTIVFLLFSPQLISLFSTDSEVIQVGTDFLHLLSLGFIFMAFSTVLARAMAGAGDTLTPMVISGICLFGIRIPLSVFLSQGMNLAARGVWLGILISSIARGLIIAFWFGRGKWKYKMV